MPVIARSPEGKVVSLWGTALIRGADGKLRLLKVGDVASQEIGDSRLVDASTARLQIVLGTRPVAPGALELAEVEMHARDAKLINGAVSDLALITGQKPEIRRARKSIAQFKLREGMPIGAHVTLRGDRMWEFLDRLLSLALPRIRDFRGLSPKQFDGRGNYTFGLTEQVMFHEIDQDRIDRVRGMDITFVTTATTDDEGRPAAAGRPSPHVREIRTARP